MSVDLINDGRDHQDRRLISDELINIGDEDLYVEGAETMQ